MRAATKNMVSES